MAVMKKIIVCCDGTGKSGNDDKPITNVHRLFKSVKPGIVDGIQQSPYYFPGIGAGKSSPGAPDWWNQAVGRGLDQKIQEAYGRICRDYVDNDKIILVGYSRGAFTVRCLVDMVDIITKCGLLTIDGLTHWPELYKLWKKESADLEEYCKNLESDIRRKIRINICAVWDTVSSIGVPLPGLFGRHRPGSPNFIHSDLREGVDKAFQALALHERRHHFHSIVWKRTANTEKARTSLDQCWFVGYHSDIGGGRKDEALAHIALVWMMSRLQDDIKFRPDGFWNPEPKYTNYVTVKDSMTLPYRLARSSDRKPRAQFWTSKKLIEAKPDVDNVSEERIHSTVGFFHGLKAKQLPIGPPVRTMNRRIKGTIAEWGFKYKSRGIFQLCGAAEDTGYTV
ncbi:hypothetical protein F5Y13DRAFT_203005 [Hypoxylon sp. FL1857]|nr:hypothetical protein F5Y13DRAFT_203005 [Hypoxylon sp. FL1857]